MSKLLPLPHEGTEKLELSTKVHQLREGIRDIGVSIFLSNSDDTGRDCLSDNVITDCVVFLREH